MSCIGFFGVGLLPLLLPFPRGISAKRTAPTTPQVFALNQVTDLRVLFRHAAPDTTLATADGTML